MNIQFEHSSVGVQIEDGTYDAIIKNLEVVEPGEHSLYPKTQLKFTFDVYEDGSEAPKTLAGWTGLRMSPASVGYNESKLLTWSRIIHPDFDYDTVDWSNPNPQYPLPHTYIGKWVQVVVQRSKSGRPKIALLLKARKARLAAEGLLPTA